MLGRSNFQMVAFRYGNNEEYLIHIIAVLRIIEQKGMKTDVSKAIQALVEARKEMKPLFEFPEDDTEAKKQVLKRCFPNTRKSSRPRGVLRLLKPRRLMKCSVVSSSAIHKLSRAGLSTKCIPRTHG
jgi:hypothetical protein